MELLNHERCFLSFRLNNNFDIFWNVKNFSFYKSRNNNNSRFNLLYKFIMKFIDCVFLRKAFNLINRTSFISICRSI